MSTLNETHSAERVHIAFFGLRNAGKSSLVNAVTNQELSVVSDIKGTTTDPVRKAMELLPIGPVLIIDTPGFDDEGYLGEKRIQKTLRILSETDIAVLVSENASALNSDELRLIEIFKDKNIPYIKVQSKCDLSYMGDDEDIIYVSAKSGTNIEKLKLKLAAFGGKKEKHIFEGLLSKGDVVVLVTPIDESAPKGRLILPQVQSIRDILDNSCISVVCKESEYENCLKILGDKISLVVCDSQVFALVDSLTPENIPLTSFSILMARLKGYLKNAYENIKILDEIRADDCILISEGCTHHRQCKDIGTVKLPALIKKYTGLEPKFEFTQGKDFPEDLSKFKLILHCGACMLNDREVGSRMQKAIDEGVSFSNYGMAIAYMNGIIKRSTAIFEELK